ncbi:hypothetical protein Pgy4_43682, partial [Pseudomonas savastanoi pv. glycinea str. race 4]
KSPPPLRKIGVIGPQRVDLRCIQVIHSSDK